MHNQENLEEGYFGDLAKNIIGRPAYAKASKVAQTASDYVRAAADKLSGVSQSLAKEPEILSPTKSWRIPVDAEEGRQAVEHYHNAMSYRLDSLVRKHAKDAQWDLDNLRDQVDPKVSFHRYEIRNNIEKERVDAEEQAAKAASEAGKKRKPKPIKDVTDAEIAKTLQDKHKPIERRREIISTLIGSAHSVLANHVSNAKEAIYQNKKPHTGIHLNTGFSGFALDEDHITAQYKKAWDSAGEHQASMPSPEQLFGSHTHHVGEGHDWILAPEIIGTGLAKEVGKANKQARKAYADAVKIATGHINNLNSKRAEQRAANAAGTQLKLVEAYNNHHVKLDYGMMYGGFPSKKSKFLIEVAEGGDGGLQPGNPNTQPNIPVQGPGGDYPHPPGNPGYWYRFPSGPFTGDGEMPGTPPGPNDPRWGEWDRQWQESNPKPTRQPNESDKDFRKRVDDYRKLLEQYRVWKYQYLKWWQRTYGHGVVHHANTQ